MQKALIFSLGFLIGLIACWNLRVTVSRQDVFDIKNTLQQQQVDAAVARSNLLRTLDKIEQCQILIAQKTSDIAYSIGENCQPKNLSTPFRPE